MGPQAYGRHLPALPAKPPAQARPLPVLPLGSRPTRARRTRHGRAPWRSGRPAVVRRRRRPAAVDEPARRLRPQAGPARDPAAASRAGPGSGQGGLPRPGRPQSARAVRGPPTELAPGRAHRAPGPHRPRAAAPGRVRPVRPCPVVDGGDPRLPPAQPSAAAGLAGRGHADVQWLLATLPGHLVPEVEAWIRVLRGEGRRPSPVMGWALIRRYLAIAAPVLRQWGDRGEVDSLRSITTDDVQAALKSRPGSSVRRMQTALRSLFRALKRERLIFRDPARGITVTRASRLPQPLPSDRLRGLLDRAPTTLAKLAVALVAIHALRPVELRRLHLADLNRARGRLTVRRPVAGRDRIVILNELTLRLAGTWLRERAQRWPHNTNPHLLISQQTAVDPSQPPVCRFTVQKLFFPLAITPGQLRADRILDEARHTADPVHLMRLFAIADNTAMKYVYTAHPERRAVPPR